MAKGARYRLAYRRRREHKTDYQARRILAISDTPRFVVRVSNKLLIVQTIQSLIEGDKVLSEVTSKELFDKYGWKASGKSIQAAYLLGLIAGYKTKSQEIGKAYLDIGLKRPTKGSKVFSVVKGAIDSGLEVPCDSDVIPSPERISGKDVVEYAKNIEDPATYEKQFSAYLRKGINPESIQEHFEEVKKKIMEDWTK
ncbi:50S ribosomal protein L18 [Candidatus Bathyarchaeota archaeon]|nr:50S ribosomal protein L18 [Candidatus Bathyarchaeota archaeon]